uniref:Reverse transcriptase domain-containing protein n=1 Tax=Lactuca sativa TaxID=4236 RepID=A0A9R1WHY0_LACSA|nr:hypothetical protein LSAT_V11C100006010 [Lactuca sativa]
MGNKEGMKMQCIQSLVELDSNLEKGEGEPTLLTERLMLQKKIKGLNRVKSLDFLQKDKIKWAIKGYENSIFFHGIHNKKCKHMAVQGVLVDGESFTDDVMGFFSYSNSPLGCNLSFIALIPKVLDAKTVKDFRPISLIRCLYKILDSPVTITHLFYVDDAVFIGEWNDSNIQNIVIVLHCFHLASGLKINLHKYKLLGIRIHTSRFDAVAAQIGCATMKTPFPYLGLTVGGNMSHLDSWCEVFQKVASKLSNKKVKTLSISGRLTLIKSVYRSLPTFFMSIYKAPKGVLSKLEALHNKFFLGADILKKNYLL